MHVLFDILSLFPRWHLYRTHVCLWGLNALRLPWSLKTAVRVIQRCVSSCIRRRSHFHPCKHSVRIRYTLIMSVLGHVIQESCFGVGCVSNLASYLPRQHFRHHWQCLGRFSGCQASKKDAKATTTNTNKNLCYIWGLLMPHSSFVWGSSKLFIDHFPSSELFTPTESLNQWIESEN